MGSSESESESEREQDDGSEGGSQSGSDSASESNSEAQSGSEESENSGGNSDSDSDDEEEPPNNKTDNDDHSSSSDDSYVPPPKKPPPPKRPSRPKKSVVRDISSSSSSDEDNPTNQQPVDLDALEEERIQMEEKMLSFAIFTKRKNLDPLEQKLFEETEHDKLSRVEDLHAELADTDTMLDSLQDHFSAIKEKLESQDDHDDVEDVDSDVDLMGKDDGDQEDEEEEEKEDSHHSEDDDEHGEKAHQSLEAAIREHAGEDALNAVNDAAGQDDSESDEEEVPTAALPDFSTFRAEAERTMDKKDKRTNRKSHLVKLLHDNKGRKPRPKVQRSRTMPDRPGEEHMFFDWRYFRKTGQMPEPLDASNSEENPANDSHSSIQSEKVLELLNNENQNGSESESESDSAGPSSLLKGLVTNKQSLQNEFDKDVDDNTTFRRASRRGSDSDQDKKKSKKGRKLPPRNNTAPPGTMRRPGEEFFDWKKFAAERAAGN